MKTEIFQKLVDKLLSKTMSGELLWDKTSGENEFKAEFSTSAVTLDKFKPAESKLFHYDLIVYNDRGDSIDRIVYNPNIQIGRDTSDIAKLYKVVHNEYFKIDKTFDDLFKELD
jgi:hypothetical protein